MIRDDGGGLNVKFIISKNPHTAKVAERAIPTAIFQEKQQIKEKFLKKWTGDQGLKNFDIASLLDWDYYKERLGGSIQKIVTIPAFLQKCLNPVPNIPYPTWLYKRKLALDDKFKQKGITSFFGKREPGAAPDVEDLVKIGQTIVAKQPVVHTKDEKYSKMEDCPKPTEDFNEWVKFQKANWR